ncbi:hypothetical protein D9M71_480510 [compost metagenome]
MHQQNVAGQACGRGHGLLEEQQHVGALVGRQVRGFLRHGHFFFKADAGERAIGLGRGLGDDATQVATPVTGDVVPDHFVAGLGNREGVVAALGEIRQAIAIVDGGYGGGALYRVLVDLGRQADRTVRGVDRDLVRLGVALEHRHLAIREFALVLLDVGRRDDEQRLFVGKRVGQKALAVDGAGVLGNTAAVGRDRTVGIAGLFCSQGSQGGAQPGGFIGRHRRHDVGRQQAQGQCAALQNHLVHKVLTPIRSSRRSSTRRSHDQSKCCNHRRRSPCSSGSRCRCCGNRHRARR